MPRRFRRSTLAVNLEADAITATLAGGFLDLYTGLQPASADAAVSGQVRLARLTFGDPAFQPAVDGRATAHPIADDQNAAEAGSASWFRAQTRDGQSVFDGSVGTSDADCVLTDVDIRKGGRVGVSSLVYVAAKGL